MSSRGKVTVTGLLLTVAVVGFYGVLQWQAGPQTTSANPPGGKYAKDAGAQKVITNDPDPDPYPQPEDPVDPDDPGGGGGPVPVQTSIMFVIDSSQHMYPRVGPNYFDMAKEAIVGFIKSPGFRTDGRYEIGVVQFTDRAWAKYEEQIHWLSPWRVYGKTSYNHLKLLAGALRRSTHHTASLMEIGIREATDLLMTEADPTSDKHIILLTTGEYRLPQPCPPDGFSCTDAGCSTASCDLEGIGYCSLDQPDGICMRACHIRYFANRARDNDIRISTIRLGADWFNHAESSLDSCPEPDDPYGSPPNYCLTPNQPDRGGLLREVANSSSCDATAPVGNYARINPAMGIGCTGDCTPGTARTIVDTMVRWMCDWYADDDPDNDVVPDFCDNCPDTSNPRQRDCDRNGLGDLCQNPPSQCGPGTDDEDCDGIRNDAPDLCPDADDCLVADWVEARGCELADYPDYCWYDCDNNDIEDACSEAQTVTAMAGTPAGTTWPLEDVWLYRDDNIDGELDCCQASRFICDDTVAGCCDSGGLDCYIDFDPVCCLDNPAFCECDPHPELCDVPTETLYNPDEGLVEEFNVCDGNCGVNFFPAYQDENDGGVANTSGWRLTAESSTAVNAVQVLEETDERDAGDPNDDVTFRYVRIGIDSGSDTSGASPLIIDGPAFHIPLGGCAISNCAIDETYR